MKNLSIYLFLSLATLFVVSCTASKSGNNPDTKKEIATKEKNDLGVSNENIPLSNYLRKIPGLRVTGRGNNAKVSIPSMGNSSLMGGNAPLFIIDGVRVGTDLSQVSGLVETSNIKNLRVLKSASETSFYGSAGANGVIIITTKKGKD